MSTRNVTMVVHRSESSKYVDGFAIHPSEVSDKSYVNMYLHHDGYPEYQGVQLAKWVKHMQDVKGFTNFGDPSRIASHLVKDFHYNSQYLYPNVDYISCWNNHDNSCVFVNKVQSVIDKWSNDGFEYTDWSKNPNNQENVTN